MLLNAFNCWIPLMVCFNAVICLDIVRADGITDGDHTLDLANLSTIQNRSDFVISKENPGSNTVSFRDTSVPEWLDDYQTKPKKKSKLNLAFLPGLAILFLFIFVFFRACKWYRDSSKIKDRGCSYDVASYVILVQGDKHFNDVDIGDNYDTVNSYNSYLRSGAYETITSSRSLQYRMDSQMYDTVTSYSQYLQKIEKESNLEIELKQIPSDGSPSPKQPHFTKKTAKGQVKLPQESRFSIKPALDNYMRLKGAYQKSPMSPKSVRYNSVDRIDGSPRKTGSRMNITVNAASAESLQSATNRTYGRQMSTECHRPSPSRSISNVIRLENLRRSVSEDAPKMSRRNTKDEVAKKKSKKCTEENLELIQNNLCHKPVRMVDAETQCELSYQTTSPLSSSKRRRRLVSVRSDAKQDYDVNDVLTITENGKTSVTTCVTEIAEKHTENGEDLPEIVIQDDLKDDQPPLRVKPTVFSVCAVVHDIDTLAHPVAKIENAYSDDKNSQPNKDSETGNEVKKPDIDHGHKCCQSNGSICYTKGNNDILTEKGKHHSCVSNGNHLENKDHKKSENGFCKISRNSLPCVSTLSSEGTLIENNCHLNTSKGNMSNCIARRSSFHNISQSKHENAIQIQNDLSQVQGTFIEMVH
ncbi:uncharacterized protein LOC132547588 [Ylistrum balloti]|uniref:uncharacterized protein LOC132547588 n=1 Tax=Ylistrum balloti TaxID=509963 RepID=UPI002905C39B|nr:uncharacterized protein LOC132547588 [Ylistrum balloti]